MHHKLRFAVAAALAFGCIALFGLAISSADPTLFDGYYPVLLILNVFLVITLFGTVVAMGWQLMRRYRAGIFGSKLTVRLTLSTMVLAVVPTIVLFFISSAFIARSIEAWFDVRVERALESGVTITRSILSRQQADTEEEARRIAQTLRNVPQSLLMGELLQQVEHLQGADALVLTGNLTAVAAASGSKLDLILPSMPGHLQIQAAKNTGIYSTVDGDIFEAGEQNPDAAIELLIPDLDARPDLLDTVIASKPDIIGHNIETVERLTPVVRSKAKYRTSLETLRYLSAQGVATKSGLMVGLGESDDEVLQTLHDLRDAGVGIVTLGQYLRPTLEHYPVAAYITPEKFEWYRLKALEMGFSYCASAPLVRSSYMAEEALKSVKSL